MYRRVLMSAMPKSLTRFIAWPPAFQQVLPLKIANSTSIENYLVFLVSVV
jgi:hypothetical protein